MAGRQGKHFGSFAKGFSDSLIAMMRLGMTMELYQARAEYYRERGWAATHPKETAAQQKQRELDEQIRSGHDRALGGGGGGAGFSGGDPDVRQHIIDWANDHGKDPSEALAMWRQESGYGTNNVGDGNSSFGDFQFHFGGMNPKMPNKGMGDDFLRDTGIDVRQPLTKEQRLQAVDYALDRMDKHGFSDWANSAKTLGLGSRWSDARKTETAKADTTPDTAKPVKPGTEKTKVGPTGGPDVPVKGGPAIKTDAEGRSLGPDGKPVPNAKQAQADTGVQVASMDDTMGLEEFLKQHPEAAGHVTQQDRPDPIAVPQEDSGALVGRDLDQRKTILPPSPQSTTYPQYQRGIPLGPEMRTGAPPNVGITPSSVPPPPPPPPQYGPSQRTGAPPNVGITPSSVPEPVPNVNMVRPEPPGPAAATINPQTDRSPVVSSEADKPAPAVQPVSSSAPPAAPVTPRVDNSRFTMVDAPNIDPTQRSRMGNPQITALNLASLWGPNPPLSQRGAQTAPSAQIKYSGQPTPVGQGLNPSGNMVLNQPGQDVRSVPVPMPPVRPPDMDDAGIGVALGSRKGGPIQRFERGGIPTRPTMKYYYGAGVQNSWQPPAPTPTPYSTFQPAVGQPLPTTQPPQMGGLASTGAYANSQLGYQPFDMWGWLGQQSGSPILGGQQAQTALQALTPAQQQWYNEQVSNEQAAGGRGKWYYNPASYPTTPAATPAAPAAPAAPAKTVDPTNTVTTAPQTDVSTIDPTTVTSTSVPGVKGSTAAKSYDPNVDATTGAGFANTSNTGGTNYNVGTDDKLKTTSDNTISGSRKGGPIRRYAGGGGIPSQPTMRFAVGGGAYATPGLNYLMSPNYIGPTFQGGWAGSTPYSALAPNQQSWADTTRGLLDQIYGGGTQDASFEGAHPGRMGPVDTSQWGMQITPMPDAIWPAKTTPATPLNEPPPTSNVTTTAPTDVSTIDPTSTTTTGIPGVPNVVTAKTYDPNVDQKTGAGFANTSNVGGTNYSVGSEDTLQTDTSGTTISGSRRGGPITPRARYDDGGGVSPSVAGMPPGLAQQGAAPIPPIYFNPATYAAAGAPVGKGVSATSAPTYNAGAIPSLPMFKGGAVAFDDGGGVGGLSDPGLSEMAMMDMQDARDDARDQTAPVEPPTPQSDKDAGWYINPQDTGAAAAGGGTTSRDSTPPPDPIAPQIGDDQGNPSKGLIGAITSGLHWLGEHLGLIGGAQAHPAIAQDPQTQTARQQHVNYSPDSATYLSPEGYDELKDAADPTHSLHEAYANIAGLEQGWKWAMMRGDDATAGRLAASILHYSVLTSQNLSAKAQEALYNGDLKKTVEYINQASDAVPDGRLMHATLSPDGKTVTFEDKNLNGQVVWRQSGAAQEVLERATALGRSGQIQWTSLESQAAKYDSTFAQMAKNRNANAVAASKEAADARAQADANAQIAKFGPEYDETGAAAPTAPGQPPPALIPVGPALPGPPPSPGRSADTTTAQSAAPPPNADSSMAARGPTGHGGALPGPGQGDIPASGAQDVDIEHSVAYQQVPQRVNFNPDGSYKYFMPDGRPIVGGQPMHKVPPIDEVTFKAYSPQVQQAYTQRQHQYEDAVKANTELMNKDIDGQRRDIAADLISRRQKQMDQAKLTAASDLDTRQGIRQKEEQQRGWTHEEEKPLTPELSGKIEGVNTIAMTPRYAQYDNGVYNENKSLLQAKGAYDLGSPATGGLERITRVGDAVNSVATWNTHIGKDKIGDLMDGLARNIYSLDPNPQTVDHGYGPMYQVNVYRGPRGSTHPTTLLIPQDDFDTIAGIRGEFRNAPPQTSNRGMGSAPASAPLGGPETYDAPAPQF